MIWDSSLEIWARAQGQPQGESRSRFGSAMKAVRRRAAGAQILMTEHVEQLWLTGYKCAAMPAYATPCLGMLGVDYARSFSPLCCTPDVHVKVNRQVSMRLAALSTPATAQAVDSPRPRLPGQVAAGQGRRSAGEEGSGCGRQLNGAAAALRRPEHRIPGALRAVYQPAAAAGRRRPGAGRWTAACAGVQPHSLPGSAPGSCLPHTIDARTVSGHEPRFPHDQYLHESTEQLLRRLLPYSLRLSSRAARCAQGSIQPQCLERFSGQQACIALYKRFIESPNFASWFERRRQAAWALQARRGSLQAALPGVHCCSARDRDRYAQHDSHIARGLRLWNCQRTFDLALQTSSLIAVLPYRRQHGLLLGRSVAWRA